MTNCQDSIDDILFDVIDEFHSTNPDTIADFLRNISFQDNDVFRFNIIITKRVNNRVARLFNHSFLIMYNNYQFYLLDAWEGIHCFNVSLKTEQEMYDWVSHFINIIDTRYMSQEFINFFYKDYDRDLDWYNTYPTPSTYHNIYARISNIRFI